MDWQAFFLSLKLAAATLFALLPVSIILGRKMAAPFRGKKVIEALITFPLVLPPTVLGYGLLVLFGGASPIGALYQELFGRPLVFSFDGLLAASIIANLPFALLPIERAFASIDPMLREAALVSGATPWQVFRRIEFPLVLPGIISAMMMSFAHTMGEFGAVLMIGGNIPGVTRTAAIALYDRVQSLDSEGATAMALLLFGISMMAMIGVSWALTSLTQRKKSH